MPDPTDIDAQERQYLDFVETFHKLKAAQHNGKDPSYTILAATLHISKSTVSKWRGRMRQESGCASDIETIPPELLKAFRRAVEQAVARERELHKQELETCYENETSLAQALEDAETALLASQKTIQDLKERLSAAEAHRNLLDILHDRLQISHTHTTERLSEARATSHFIEALKRQNIDVLRFVTQAPASPPTSSRPTPPDHAVDASAMPFRQRDADEGRQKGIETAATTLRAKPTSGLRLHSNSPVHRPRQQRWRPLATALRLPGGRRKLRQPTLPHAGLEKNDAPNDARGFQ
ncbi:hypothetical protein [Noviherbaspirillum malthae]|uniref:hypothetical protein n=1 Tax=Noviherbaspirillum malthae TaxID=1260987 RepID=UPI00189035FD|nr:hypothetical protein [Noviherbaspirillum malthae]